LSAILKFPIKTPRHFGQKANIIIYFCSGSPDENNGQKVVISFVMKHIRIVATRLNTWLGHHPSFLVVVIICSGIGLRLRQYLANRSLWFDEILLARNLVSKSLLGLAGPLDDGQGAPIGFLWVVKEIITIAGHSEYALRFFPLGCSLVALPVFYAAARKYLAVPSACLALGLFAISESLIYYASEVKQYSSDVLMALLGLLILFPLLEKKLNYSLAIFYGFLGASLIWMSHPIIFVLASVGVVASWSLLRQREYHRARLAILAATWWGLSFLIFYFVSLRYLTQHQPLLNYWGDSFAPPLSAPLTWLNWVIESFLDIFAYPIMGLSVFGLGAFAYLTGAISLYSRHKPYLFSLLAPLLFALLAASFRMYPFAHRHLLFVMPVMIILMVEGMSRLLNFFASNNMGLAGFFLVGLLMYHPLLQAGHNLLYPALKEEIKPVIDYTNQHWQAGDTLYLYHSAYLPFEYYASSANLPIDDFMVGVASKDGDLSEYALDLNQLTAHDRVWLIFSHVRTTRGINEEQLFLNYLNLIGGLQTDRFQTTGAAVYLYEFN
jgi:hypothetical protein